MKFPEIGRQEPGDSLGQKGHLGNLRAQLSGSQSLLGRVRFNPSPRVPSGSHATEVGALSKASSGRSMSVGFAEVATVPINDEEGFRPRVSPKGPAEQ